MLGIQIGNEYLELPPGTTLEMVEANPFLQFADAEVRGNYSLPSQVKAVPKNLRLLKYSGLLQTRIDNSGIDSKVYGNGLQHSQGKIKIETANINVNRPNTGDISFYYLTGISSFYQDIKKKSLRDINMGGERFFATHDAFWDHINLVLRGDPNEYDYAFYPVVNKGWTTEGGDIEIMNRIFFGSGDLPAFDLSATASPIFGPANVIVPFPYLKTVLINAVEYAGWKIEGDILTDPDFEKITMINFRAIDWVPYPHINLIGTKSPVRFDLADHLPDILISEFLIALQNRFAWWYDFDYVSKKITIKKLGSLVSFSQKDMTKYASPLVPKKVQQSDKIYALRNNFISGGGQGIDLNNTDYQGDVNKVADLPAAAEARADHVYLVKEENNFYWCINDSGWKWQILSSNNSDYAPDGSNEEIITAATTVDMERFSNYIDLAPRLDNQGVLDASDVGAEWSIHLCFFYGMRENKSNQLVPFASHHVYDSKGVQLGNWSLAYKAKKTDGTEIGLYDLNWKSFLALSNSKEEFQVVLSLPFHEYQKLKFSNSIVVDGVKMFVKEKKSFIPYRGSVELQCVRILA